MIDSRLIEAKEELEANGYDTDGICLGFVGCKTLTHYVKLKDFVTIPESDVPADIPHGCKLAYHVEVCDQNGYYLTTKDPSEEDHVDRFFAIIYIDEEE